MLQEVSIHARHSVVLLLVLVTLLFAGMIVASPSVSPLTGVANAQEDDNGWDDERDDNGGDGEAPVGGVETGLGGAAAAGSAVPALTVGSALLMAGTAAAVTR